MAKGITLLLETIQKDARQLELDGANSQVNFWKPVFNDVDTPQKVSHRKKLGGPEITSRAFIRGVSEYSQVNQMLHAPIYRDFLDASCVCVSTGNLLWLSDSFLWQFCNAVASDFPDYQTEGKVADFRESINWFRRQAIASERGSRDYLEGLLGCLLMTSLKGFGNYAAGFRFDPLPFETQPPNSGSISVGAVAHAPACCLVEVLYAKAYGSYITGDMRFNLEATESAVLGRWDPKGRYGSKKKIVARPIDRGEDFTVSRAQCEIRYHDGSWWLEDASHNGTIIVREGNPDIICVHQGAAELAFGDVIYLSKHSTGFRFELR